MENNTLVQIDIDMPKRCVNCKWSDRGSEIGRIRCRLTKHEFSYCEVAMNRFPTCPLKEVK